MKYFKPGLLARCRSRDDQVAEAAADEWEVAVAAYRSRFDAILPRLPDAVGPLCSRHSLHDAGMIGAAFATRKALFGILLRIEGPASATGEVLELSYRPVEGPDGGVDVRSHPEVVTRQGIRVLYDEFDLDEGNGFFSHSFLLSDGREIEVHFKDLEVNYLDEVVTPVQITEKKWPSALPGPGRMPQSPPRREGSSPVP